MIGWLVLLLASCHPVEDDPDPARNGVRVRVVAHDPDWVDGVAWFGDHGLTELRVRISDVVLEAEGGDGEVSLSSGQPALIDVLGGGATPEVPVFDLAVGTYDELELEARLGPGNGHDALEATGVVDERPYHLVIDEELLFGAERDAFTLGGGPDATVRFVMRPEAWFDGLELPEAEEEEEEEEEGEDTGDEPPEPVFELARGGPNDALYRAVLARVVASTQAVFPGEVIEDD